MKFHVLGPFEVTDEGTVLTPTAPKLRTVLSLLAVNYRRVTPVDSLIEEIWPEDPPISAITTLQTYVYQLRRLFARHPWLNADDLLVTRPLGYEAAIDPQDLDLCMFERHAKAGRDQLKAGQVEEAAESLRNALGLWRGAALAGVRRGPLLQAQATYLDGSMLEALVLRIEADLQLGRHRELVSELRQLTAKHLLYEDLHAKLMIALYRSDWRSAALAAYHDLRATLDRELGLEPSPGLQRLHCEILSDMPSLQFVPRPRVRAAGSASLVTPAQIPPGILDFVGREAELATLESLLSSRNEAPRLIVIDGATGVGKTVLASRAAHRARSRYPDCQLFADLGGGAPADPAQVLAGFLRAIGIDEADIPASQADRAHLFRSWSADRAGLILLDDAVCAAQVMPLLPSGPRWSVLITSRHALTSVAGMFRLRLLLPPVDEGVELLGKVAGRQRVEDEPDEAVAIVRLCGRLPLAVRVAGQRLVAAPRWQLAKLRERLVSRGLRLSELSNTECDLRARFAASYWRLSDADRAAVGRLACSRDLRFASERVCSLLGIDQRAAEDLLERLSAANVLEIFGSGAAFRLPLLFGLFVRECVAGDVCGAQPGLLGAAGHLPPALAVVHAGHGPLTMQGQ